MAGVPPDCEEINPEPLRYQTWVLRVSIHCEGCKRKVKRILHSVEGVYTIDVDTKKHRVIVTGNVDSSTLIKKLEKSGKHAELWSDFRNRIMNNNNNNNPCQDHFYQQPPPADQNNPNPDEAQNHNHPPNGPPDNSNPGPNNYDPNANPNDQQPQQVRFEENTPPAGDPNMPPPDGGAAPGGGGGGGAKKKKKKKKSSGGNNNNNTNNNNNMNNNGEGVGEQPPPNGGPPNTEPPPPQQGPCPGPGPEQGPCSGPGPGPYSSASGMSPPQHPPPQYNRVYEYPPAYYAPPQPVYAMSYNTAYPRSGYTASYYSAASPYSYSYVHSVADMEPPPPSDTFEIFSDENPNACSVM